MEAQILINISVFMLGVIAGTTVSYQLLNSKITSMAVEELEYWQTNAKEGWDHALKAQKKIKELLSGK